MTVKSAVALKDDPNMLKVFQKKNRSLSLKRQEDERRMGETNAGNGVRPTLKLRLVVKNLVLTYPLALTVAYTGKRMEGWCVPSWDRHRYSETDLED
jgi:hypothetical protein